MRNSAFFFSFHYFEFLLNLGIFDHHYFYISTNSRSKKNDFTKADY